MLNYEVDIMLDFELCSSNFPEFDPKLVKTTFF